MLQTRLIGAMEGKRGSREKLAHTKLKKKIEKDEVAVSERLDVKKNENYAVDQIKRSQTTPKISFAKQVKYKTQKEELNTSSKSFNEENEKNFQKITSRWKSTRYVSQQRSSLWTFIGNIW